MLRYLLLTLLLTAFFAPASAQKMMSSDAKAAGLSEAGLERYESFLEQEIEDGDLPMAEAIIYRHGEVGYHSVLGKSDLNKGSDLQANQIYHLMSMTKPIVTVAFMMLYEEGHFQLTDKVSKYLPEFEKLVIATATDQGIQVETTPAETAVTIEQVLTHTAGFSHGLGGTKLDNEIAFALYYAPHPDIGSRVKKLSELPLLYEPGTTWHYSTSPDILSRLIEVFSGQTTAEFLQERLFDPLGMDDTGYNVAPEKTSRLVANHEFKDGKIAKAAMQLPSSGITVYGGSFGLYSTASDYLKFCRMLLNKGTLDGKQYLSRKTLELMTMNHVGDLRDGGEGFGLGFGVETDVSKTDVPGSVGMYRWSGAYSTFFFIDPKEDLIAILMSQRSPYSGYHEKMMRQMVYGAIGD